MATTEKSMLQQALLFRQSSSRRCLRRFFLAICAAVMVVTVASSLGAAPKEGTSKKSASAKKAEYALIFGTVWAPDNRPAAGVTVKIRPSDKKKAKWTLVSDRRGEFAQRVPAGTADYVIWAEVPKKKKPAAEVTVHVDGNERVDTGLHLTE